MRNSDKQRIGYKKDAVQEVITQLANFPDAIGVMDEWQLDAILMATGRASAKATQSVRDPWDPTDNG